MEESFKVIKYDLQGRPVYVKIDEHIKGYFFNMLYSISHISNIEYYFEHEYSIEKL
ncbi:MAG: hypothetical protein ACK5LT_03800 [Lachnospirales bacterium]